MRWRTVDEVKVGKGERICANIACGRNKGLEGMEVVFGYTEEGKQKNVLVKCVLCEKCAHKMRRIRGKDSARRKHKQKDETKGEGGNHEDSDTESIEHGKRRRRQELNRDGEAMASEKLQDSEPHQKPRAGEHHDDSQYKRRRRHHSGHHHR